MELKAVADMSSVFDDKLSVFTYKSSVNSDNLSVRLINGTPVQDGGELRAKVIMRQSALGRNG